MGSESLMLWVGLGNQNKITREDLIPVFEPFGRAVVTNYEVNIGGNQFGHYATVQLPLLANDTTNAMGAIKRLHGAVIKGQTITVEQLTQAKINLLKSKLTCDHNQLRQTSADNKPYKKALCMNITTTGFCFYGSRCADAHSEIERRWFERMEADQLELKEKLKDLERKFWQRMEGVKSPTGVHPDANKNSFFYKTSMCKFASSGVCAWGSRCWYAHSESELRTPPPIPLFRSGASPSNDSFASAETSLTSTYMEVAGSEKSSMFDELEVESPSTVSSTKSKSVECRNKELLARNAQLEVELAELKKKFSQMETKAKLFEDNSELNQAFTPSDRQMTVGKLDQSSVVTNDASQKEVVEKQMSTVHVQQTTINQSSPRTLPSAVPRPQGQPRLPRPPAPPMHRQVALPRPQLLAPGIRQTRPQRPTQLATLPRPKAHCTEK